MQPDEPDPVDARRSLRGKVLVLLLAIGLGPLLIAGGVNINRAVEKGKVSERQRLAQAARFAAVSVTDLFARGLEDVRLLARRFPVESFDFAAAERALDRGSRLAALEQWRDAPLISRLVQEFATLFVALDDGRVVYTTPFSNHPLIDMAERPWFEALADRGGLAPGPLPPLTSKADPGVVVFAPLLHRDGRAAGYLGAVIASDVLADILARAEDGLADSGSRTMVAIIGPDGHIAAHSDASRVGSPLEGELWSDRAPGTRELMLGGVPVVASWGDVGRAGWKVVIVTHRDDAYRYVYGLIWLLMVVIVLTFVLVLLMADYSARRLLEPIHELEQGAQMIGAGSLDYRIELDTHNRDELGRLAHSFNAMGESVQRSRQQLETYGRSLETARKELDAIVYGITHDLKKSLRGIEAFASFLGEDYADDLDEDGLEMLGSIAVNVDRINQLADDLIGLVEHEREPGQPTSFEAQALLEEVRERVLERHRGEVVLEGEMPTITGDRARLMLVFDNLIDNGLKFNRSAEPRVVVRCHDGMLTWRFDVTDNGIGIEPRFHDRIFELFARLNQQDEFAGNGTGLNLARRIVEEHRGQLAVGAHPDGGCVFTVTLPKESEALTEPSLAAWRLPGESGDVDLM